MATVTAVPLLHQWVLPMSSTKWFHMVLFEYANFTYFHQSKEERQLFKPQTLALGPDSCTLTSSNNEERQLYKLHFLHISTKLTLFRSCTLTSSNAHSMRWVYLRDGIEYMRFFIIIHCAVFSSEKNLVCWTLLWKTCLG